MDTLLNSELKLISAKARLFRTVKAISPDYELECRLERMRWERRLSFAISRSPRVVWHDESFKKED